MAASGADNSLEDRYRQIKTKIRASCAKANRSEGDIELMAVSKGHQAEKIRSLYQEGQTWFGESYYQEFAQKYKIAKAWGLNLKWSFIGRLQSNKIRKIIEIADEIHSLASLKHAAVVAKEIQKKEILSYPVFLAVNCAGEVTKEGFSLEEVEEVAKTLEKDYPSLKIRGMMTIPPRLDSHKMPLLYQDLAATANSIGEGKLSLGMSQDMEIAIRAGSDILRIGSALMGKRL